MKKEGKRTLIYITYCLALFGLTLTTVTARAGFDYDCKLQQYYSGNSSPTLRSETSHVAIETPWIGQSQIKIHLWGQDSQAKPDLIPFDQLKDVGQTQKKAQIESSSLLGHSIRRYLLDSGLLEGAEDGTIVLEHWQMGFSVESYSKYILNCSLQR